MNKIASFQVNHDLLHPGIYVSRIDFTDIVTYDIRVKTPNAGDYLEPRAMHTTEHLFATFARNSQLGSRVVYFGPMGCLTGYYLLLKGVPHAEAIALIREAFSFIANYSGEIPGSARAECGNYLAHDLDAAKREAALFLPVVSDWSETRLAYNTDC